MDDKLTPSVLIGQKNIKERFKFNWYLILFLHKTSSTEIVPNSKKEETKTTIDILVKVSIINKCEFWLSVSSGMCRVNDFLKHKHRNSIKKD